MSSIHSLYSPTYNFSSKVTLRKEVNSSWTLHKRHFTIIDMNPFDVAGCIPYLGQVSGFIRVILALIDLSFYYFGKKEANIQTRQPVSHTTSSQQLPSGGYRLGGTSSSQPPKQQLSTTQASQDSSHLAFQAIKGNALRGVVEMIPVAGQVITIVYSIILYKQQTTQIIQDIETHKTPDALLANPTKKTAPKPQERGQVKTIKDIGQPPLFDLGNMLQVGRHSFETLEYQDCKPIKKTPDPFRFYSMA